MLGQLAKAVARKKNTSAKKLRRRQHGEMQLDLHSLRGRTERRTLRRRAGCQTSQP